MSIFDRLSTLLERTRLSEFCPVSTIDENNVFRCIDGHIGMAWFGEPLAGGDDRLQGQLLSLLELDFPANTVIQFFNIEIPDATFATAPWRAARITAANASELASHRASEICEQVAEFINSGATRALIPNEKLANQRLLMVTVKIPADQSIDSNVDAMQQLVTLMRQFSGGLIDSGVPLTVATAQDYLRLTSLVLNPWSDGTPDYNPEQYISEQLLPPGYRMRLGYASGLHSRWRSAGVEQRLNTSVISVSRWPSPTHLGIMNHIIGDPQGMRGQIGAPSTIVSTIVLYDRNEGAARVKRNATWVNGNVFSGMVKYIPTIADKKTGFDIMLRAIDTERRRVVGVATALIVHHRSRKMLDKAIGAAEAHLGSHRFLAGRESAISFPVLTASLPFGASAQSVSKLERHLTMSSEHAVQTLPLFADFLGTSRPRDTRTVPSELYVTRRGSVVTLNDFTPNHDNANFVIAAMSGAGKSFLTQYKVLCQRALGTRIWIIDAGHSYLKLCALLGGQYIDFQPPSTEQDPSSPNYKAPLCLNPFTHVNNFTDDAPTLLTILQTMADPNGSLFASDSAAAYRSRLSLAMQSVYSKIGNAMTVDDIYRFLIGQVDEEARFVGNCLFEFSSMGQYGPWVNGANNLKMDSPLVVLELQGLSRQPHLRAVVLQMLVAQIGQAIYDSNDYRKMVLIDEALDLVANSQMKDFIPEAYRKFRKHAASIGLVCQSLDALYESPIGETVRSTASLTYAMAQKSSVVARLEEKRLLELGAYGWGEMRSVFTMKGHFSEFMVISDKLGSGVFRLVLPKYVQLLFSTEESEREVLFKAIANGVDIHTILTERARAFENSNNETRLQKAA